MVKAVVVCFLVAVMLCAGLDVQTKMMAEAAVCHAQLDCSQGDARCNAVCGWRYAGTGKCLNIPTGAHVCICDYNC